MKAAENENIEAAKVVGASYYIGKGIKKDYKKSLYWFLVVAEKIKNTPGDDNKKLLSIIANMYLTGRGTMQDFSEAAKWAEKAAEMGDGQSQAIMAFLLYTGQGVLQDKKAAWKWVEKSAEQGNDLGQVLLGVFNQFAKTPDMNAALKWYEKSAKQGNPAAQHQLATFYEEGVVVPKDLKKAKYYYEQAANSKKSDNLVKALKEFEMRQKKQQ